MRKKPRFQFMFLLLVFIMALPVASGSVRADDISYAATIRYYDNIQITYTLKYPSGGVWSGSGDIPIGGLEIADQVYCADPFVPFHSRADSSVWQNGATVDKKSGYVVAAPWAVTGAVKQSAEAVNWLVTNGFRGNYLVADDPVSVASVERLKNLYFGLPGNIDKEIALMATKVAIWKTIAGDSVVISRTSLDSNPLRRRTFDALVQAMVTEATSGSPRNTGADTTTFAITIDGSRVQLFHADATHTYYGPLTIKAGLTGMDGVGDPVPLLDGVFLTVTGQELSGIEFVEDDALGAPLPSGSVYGTHDAAWYLPGGAFTRDDDRGGQWESSEFYLKIPNSRHDSDHAPEDLLTIGAMAKATDVPLLEGTPVLFVYESGGIQDWDHAQAFIGAAKEGMTTNLYAQARHNTGEHELGEIQISKQVINGSAMDGDVEFTFCVFASYSDDGSDIEQVYFGNLHITGAVSVSDYEFTLKNGGLAIIDGLPARHDGATVNYWIVESVESDYEQPRYDVTVAQSAPVSGNGYTAGPFQMDISGDHGLAIARFTNIKTIPKAYIEVSKGTLKYFSDGAPPEIVTGERFRFKIEYSDDGEVWRPLNLNGIFMSGSENMTGANGSAAGGEFSLETVGGSSMLEVSDSAIIELDSGYSYRITEINPGIEYTPMYIFFRYHSNPDNPAEWFVTPMTSAQDSFWIYIDGSYTTSGFSVNDGDHYAIMFMNIDADFYDLTISKTVTGSGLPDHPDDLFAFTAYYMDSYNPAMPAPWPIAVSTIASADTSLITGIPDDSRVGMDDNGRPVVFYLKSGETATIKGIPAGNYVIAELPGEDYFATYAVGDSEYLPVNEKGATGMINISNNTVVLFRNTAPSPYKPEEPNDPDEPELPEEPDNPETPDTPETPDNPETPEKPRAPEEPYRPEEPGSPDEPNDPDEPRVPDEPNSPEDPRIPEDPDAPDKPYDPTEPENPDTPDRPNEPDRPSVPNDPDTIEPPSPETPRVRRSPQTGDNYKPILVLFMLIAGIGCLVAAKIYRSKEQTHLL